MYLRNHISKNNVSTSFSGGRSDVRLGSLALGIIKPGFFVTGRGVEEVYGGSPVCARASEGRAAVRVLKT